MKKEVVHANPVWRDQSDFIVGAVLPDSAGTEQLWARQVAANRFVVCCIPFFLYDLALGDLVETDAEHTVKRVVEPSGRFVFRVWFAGSSASHEEVVEKLLQKGALVEWSSQNLLAVDAKHEQAASKISEYLSQCEQASMVSYETGKT